MVFGFRCFVLDIEELEKKNSEHIISGNIACNFKNVSEGREALLWHKAYH